VELHGFLSYLVKCNLQGREYKIFGYKGKQVRDNIHSEDVARFMAQFCESAALGRGVQPGGREGQFVLDPGGVRDRGIVQRQKAAPRVSRGEPGRGPHLLLQRPAEDEGHYPGWDITISLEETIGQIVKAWTGRLPE
jgi:CDP-paratose 2-epimerase